MTNAHLLKKGLPPVVEVLIYILSIFSGAQLVKGKLIYGSPYGSPLN